MAEGYARVVAVEGATVWLEPEPAAGCGACPSHDSCGAKSGFSLFQRSARRFAMVNSFDAVVGEKVVLGLSDNALIQASLTVYILPLLGMIAAAVLADLGQWGDGITALAAVVGLAAGGLLARWRASRLTGSGRMAPVYLRRVTLNELANGKKIACEEDGKA